MQLRFSIAEVEKREKEEEATTTTVFVIEKKYKVLSGGQGATKWMSTFSSLHLISKASIWREKKRYKIEIQLCMVNLLKTDVATAFKQCRYMQLNCFGWMNELCTALKVAISMKTKRGSENANERARAFTPFIFRVKMIIFNVIQISFREYFR